VDGVTKGGEEAVEGGSDGIGAAVVEDVDMDEAGGALDGDEDISVPTFELGQMLEIGMDIAERLGGERLAGLVGLGDGRGRAGDAVSPPQAVEGGARDIVAHASAHHLECIVERQR
jgi:hypothetical protein